MHDEDLTKNLKKYLKLKKRYDEADDEETESVISEKLESLYFDLDEDEICWLKINGIE